MYALAQEWDQLAAWSRYALRVRAVARTWKEPVFCLESAAVLQGLPVFGEPKEIHLLAKSGRSWREGDVVVHSYADQREIVGDATRFTSVADTTTDLCRLLPPAFGLAVADAASRRIGSVVRVADRGRAQSDPRGVRRLDWVQERTDPHAESVGESVSRAAIEWLGYEIPELQTVFNHEGFVDRVDFFWRAQRVVGESDGYGKYDLPDPDDVKAALIREKVREDRLRRHVDGFARWDWGDTMRWRTLDDKLRGAGLQPLHPPYMAMLGTLGTNRRSGAAPRTTSTPHLR